MFTRVVTAGIVMCLVVGCAKKTAKFTGSSNDPAPVTPAPAAPGKPIDKGDKNKKEKDEKPN